MLRFGQVEFSLMANQACIVDGEFSGDVAGIEAQVDRILSSTIFRGAPTLGGFLKFIVDRTLQGKPAEINEYVIATQVFGRGAGFDPTSDTIVRTQAYRLRAKLQQYYGRPGADDLLVIEVPKGHYVPIFRSNPPGDLMVPVAAGTSVVPGTSGRVTWVRTAAGVAMVAVLCGASWLAGARESGSKVLSQRQSPQVTGFWQAFLGADRQPVVSYGNGQFLGTSRGTLLQFQSGPAGDRGTVFTGSLGSSAPGALMDLKPDAGPLYFQDDYTGVGEVLGAVSLLRAIGDRSERVDVKRSSLISTFDLESHNVIFLGAPGANNRLLRELLSARRFVTMGGSGKWEGKIRDVTAGEGQATEYRVERDAITGVIKTDYALVSVLPGTAPGRRILVLGGLLTSGTAAAAESVAQPEGISQLANKLGVQDPRNPANWPECFESVWRVKLTRGLDVVRTEVVAARAFKNSAVAPGIGGLRTSCAVQ